MTQAVVSVQEFLRTGEFGPIRLGISRDQLHGHLGQPEDWGPAPKAMQHAGIWKYGAIEFHFSGDMLWLIFADQGGKLHGGKAIALDPWILNGDATIKSVLRGLGDAHIPWRRVDWTLDDATERFQVGAGVELLFLDETQHLFDSEGVSPLARPGMIFHGFSYSARKTKTE